MVSTHAVKHLPKVICFIVRTPYSYRTISVGQTFLYFILVIFIFKLPKKNRYRDVLKNILLKTRRRPSSVDA